MTARAPADDVLSTAPQVRNGIDGSVVQFVSGEDGLDPTKLRYLDRPDFLAMNADALIQKMSPASVPKSVAARLDRKAAHARHKARMRAPPADRPVLLSERPPSAMLGTVSEAFEAQLEGSAGSAQSGYFSGRAELKPKRWRELMWLKYLDALSPPGESIGLLAAQVDAAAHRPMTPR